MEWCIGFNPHVSGEPLTAFSSSGSIFHISGRRLVVRHPPDYDKAFPIFLANNVSKIVWLGGSIINKLLLVVWKTEHDIYYVTRINSGSYHHVKAHLRISPKPLPSSPCIHWVLARQHTVVVGLLSEILVFQNEYRVMRLTIGCCNFPFGFLDDECRTLVIAANAGTIQLVRLTKCPDKHYHMTSARKVIHRFNFSVVVSGGRWVTCTKEEVFVWLRTKVFDRVVNLARERIVIFQLVRVGVDFGIFCSDNSFRVYKLPLHGGNAQLIHRVSLAASPYTPYLFSHASELLGKNIFAQKKFLRTDINPNSVVILGKGEIVIGLKNGDLLIYGGEEGRMGRISVVDPFSDSVISSCVLSVSCSVFLQKDKSTILRYNPIENRVDYLWDSGGKWHEVQKVSEDMFLMVSERLVAVGLCLGNRVVELYRFQGEFVHVLVVGDRVLSLENVDIGQSLKIVLVDDTAGVVELHACNSSREGCRVEMDGSQAVVVGMNGSVVWGVHARLEGADDAQSPLIDIDHVEGCGVCVSMVDDRRVLPTGSSESIFVDSLLWRSVNDMIVSEKHKSSHLLSLIRASECEYGANRARALEMANAWIEAEIIATRSKCAELREWIGHLETEQEKAREELEGIMVLTQNNLKEKSERSEQIWEEKIKDAVQDLDSETRTWDMELNRVACAHDEELSRIESKFYKSRIQLESEIQEWIEKVRYLRAANAGETETIERESYTTITHTVHGFTEQRHKIEILIASTKEEIERVRNRKFTKPTDPEYSELIEDVAKLIHTTDKTHQKSLISHMYWKWVKDENTPRNP